MFFPPHPLVTWNSTRKLHSPIGKQFFRVENCETLIPDHFSYSRCNVQFTSFTRLHRSRKSALCESVLFPRSFPREKWGNSRVFTWMISRLFRKSTSKSPFKAGTMCYIFLQSTLKHSSNNCWLQEIWGTLRSFTCFLDFYFETKF